MRRIPLQFLAILIMIEKCIGPKAPFNWTSQLEDELVKIYHQTTPLERRHKQRLKEAWDKEYPMYRDIDSHYLRLHARYLIRRDESNSRKPRKLEYFKWTPEFRQNLLGIYKETNTGKRNHSKRIYDEWIKKYRNMSDMKPEYLFKQAKSLVRRLKENEEMRRSRKKYVWSKDHEQELLHIFDHNIPDQIPRLLEEWLVKHPEFEGITLHQLKRQVRCFIRQRERRKADGRRSYDNMPAFSTLIHENSSNDPHNPEQHIDWGAAPVMHEDPYVGYDINQDYS